MFDDWGWDASRTDAQNVRMQRWFERIDATSMAVLELGAGTAVPTVRNVGDSLAALGASLVRVNPRDTATPNGGIALAMGALEGIRALADAFR
jgi:hypothetical protein